VSAGLFGVQRDISTSGGYQNAALGFRTLSSAGRLRMAVMIPKLREHLRVFLNELEELEADWPSDEAALAVGELLGLAIAPLIATGLSNDAILATVRRSLLEVDRRYPELADRKALMAQWAADSDRVDGNA
jgi:hypothetical protein